MNKRAALRVAAVAVLGGVLGVPITVDRVRAKRLGKVQRPTFWRRSA